MSGGASSTNDIVFTAAGNHTFYALNAENGDVLWSRRDLSGGNQTWYWSWGAPSVVNGMLFETTMGSSTTGGKLEAFALPSEITTNSTTSSSSTTSTTTTEDSALALDGSDGAACSVRACGATSGLTTSKSNDLILVCASAVSGHTVSSIKDSAGKLSFTLKTALTQASGPRVELWSAVAAGPLAADKLTVTFSSSGADSFTAFGVSGANTVAPFDGTNTNGWTDKVAETPNATITTSNSHDMLVGCETTNGALVQKPVAGFTLVQALSHTGESSAAEFQVVASPQTNQNVKFGAHDSSSNKWAMVVAGIS